MQRKTLAAVGVVCALAIAIACGKHTETPASPSSVAPASAAANGDTSSLKATAPTAQSPINGAKPSTPQVVLTIGNSTTRFVSGVPLSYRFEVYDAGGARVHQSNLISGGNGTTSYEVPVFLEADKTYRWQARAEYLGAPGPWSSQASFVAPLTGGYIKDGEIYDPLSNGKTIGEVHGPVQFSPKGITLQAFVSNVSYELPHTLLQGEYSILVTDMPANTKGGKTKVLSMSEGYSDIIENDRRYTWEKRGDPPGVIAWRVLTHNDRLETIGAERVTYDFQANETYFWRTTWGNHQITFTIQIGGPNGPFVYDRSIGMSDEYDPDPHVVWIGAPVGRSGEEGASVPGMTVRQLWVSSRPRPPFANQ
jgi:hypothetical protein